MNFKPGMNILPSSYYTHCKLRAPPTSGVSRMSAHVDLVQKKPFYASLWQLTARDRRLTQSSYIGLVKYKAKTANKPSLKPRALTALKWW